LRSAAKLLSPAASPPAVIRRAWFFCANAKAQGAVAAALPPSFSIKPLAISGGFITDTKCQFLLMYQDALTKWSDVIGTRAAE
jgi:hypothetical protein